MAESHVQNIPIELDIQNLLIMRLKEQLMKTVKKSLIK